MGTNNRFFVCVFSSSKTNTKMSMLRSSSASIKEEAVTQNSFFTAPSPTYSTFLANAAGTPGDYFSIAQSPQSLLQSVNSPMVLCIFDRSFFMQFYFDFFWKKKT